MMIYDWSRKQAHINGNQTAVSLNDEKITYGELESESNKLAGMLIRHNLSPGDRVGLFMEKTPKTIIAMLGITKAGGVYVPLDPHSPTERVAKIIKSSKPSLFFVDHDTTHQFQNIIHSDPETGLIPWIWWSAESLLHGDDFPPQFIYKDIKSQKNEAYQVIRNPARAAHILFTSGSTGQPKGVVITHANIEAFINWAVPFFNMKQGEHTSCHSPLHFDLSTFDIYGAFASGAHLHLVPAGISTDPKKLSAFILENKLNQWFSVPSALSYLAKFQVVPKGGYPDLKRLIWCGEVFPVPALQYWMRNLPDVQFTNLYGPTEATIASSYYTVREHPDNLTEIPIGEPCSNEKLLVLDKDLCQKKIGEVGDLYIEGSGLSPGYWQDIDKTKAAFFRYTNVEGRRERIYKTGDLASLGKDGLIYFHGRSDYQIKSRGYRIELGEIEAALGQDEMLREYAVVPVHIDGFDGTAIGCAYVGTSMKNGVLAPLLKQKLKDKIPSYMMPQVWQEYDLLPRNGNGKIDRKILSDQFQQKPRPQ
ncbi:MAG: D-alanine--poly(phosphoribitol) ligase [Balneola sp.]|nr:D-alanine--poly(phosphoribitol) ligase [Balneola sp.]|tara:strand:+ start:12825 stop:14426 length:1602 start_codon:yes stop_codon:yes gene_type:complete